MEEACLVKVRNNLTIIQHNFDERNLIAIVRYLVHISDEMEVFALIEKRFRNLIKSPLKVLTPVAQLIGGMPSATLFV